MLRFKLLRFMKQFKESLYENSSAAFLCDGPILLLKQSRLIAVFHDWRPIADVRNECLQQLTSAFFFFLQLEKDILQMY